jgi:hypothetical protein
MPREWIKRGLVPGIIIIAVLTYVTLLGLFLTYERQKGETAGLRQETIAKCLDAGGHIGPGVSCRHDNPQWPVGIFPRLGPSPHVAN